MLEWQIESYWKPTTGDDRFLSVRLGWATLHYNLLTKSDRSPVHPERLVVKRVIALEGDVVYARTPCPMPTVHVPAHHVWVEGDNRDKTLDSNHYGPIPLNLIQGRITHVLLPWKSFGAIRWWEFRGKTRVMKGRREDSLRWD